MDFSGFGWPRLFLTGLLIGLGLLFRLGGFPGTSGMSLGIPWADADPDIGRRSRHRLGEMLMLWAAWVAVQMLVGMPPSWLTALWAPLVIVTVMTLTYPARLYMRRYVRPLSPEEPGADDRAHPARGGWPVVLLRELIPLGAILLSILVVRSRYADLPDEMGAGWSLREGGMIRMARDEALTLLRHQTMLVYLLLAGLEGVYLIATWVRGRRRDIARRMLTAGHWLYFLFRVGWVTVFAGLNLGFVEHAARGGSPLPYSLPGLFALGLVGTGVALRARRRPPLPPASPPET
jgi:hypothetical protein